VFGYVTCGLRHRLEPLAAHGADWITDVRVESRLASNRVNLTFGDGTPVTVEMTKGLGSARKLAAAIATRMSAG